jgi:hypothetical protein
LHLALSKGHSAFDTPQAPLLNYQILCRSLSPETPTPYRALTRLPGLIAIGYPAGNKYCRGFQSREQLRTKSSVFFYSDNDQGYKFFTQSTNFTFGELAAPSGETTNYKQQTQNLVEELSGTANTVITSFTVATASQSHRGRPNDTRQRP